MSHTEADFVGSALVNESVSSSVGDDDKIYFFFTEKSQELSPYFSHSRVARVARVCKVRDYRGSLHSTRHCTFSFSCDSKLNHLIEFLKLVGVNPECGKYALHSKVEQMVESLISSTRDGTNVLFSPQNNNTDGKTWFSHLICSETSIALP